jgi:hypothetical protein
MVAVSAPSRLATYGSVYIFDCSNAFDCQQIDELHTSEPIPDAFFGVALAASGAALLVGAPQVNMIGAAYLFDCRIPSNCIQKVELLPLNATLFAQFGTAVAMSGGLAVVGAFNNFMERGSVDVFSCTSGFTCDAGSQLVIEGAVEGITFGWAVAVVDCAVSVGTLGATNTVYVYNCSTPTDCVHEYDLKGLENAELGFSIAMSETLFAVSTDLTANGQLAVDIFSCPSTAINCSIGFCQAAKYPSCTVHNSVLTLFDAPADIQCVVRSDPPHRAYIVEGGHIPNVFVYSAPVS